MTENLTVFASIKLLDGVSETDLIAASQCFQNDFVDKQSGVLRRELIQIKETEYLDIIQFRSSEDMELVLAEEQTSAACQEFFKIMEASED